MDATLAFERFKVLEDRTRSLLESGLSGIGDKVQELDGILAKFKQVSGIPGPWPKDYEPEVDIVGDNKDGTKSFTFDRRTSVFLRKVLQQVRSTQNKLRFHLYSILAVYIWAAFETYLLMLFEQLLVLRPELLKSSEAITFEAAVDHERQIISYLVSCQLERIGHFGLKDILGYLSNRISFQFENDMIQKLEKSYLVRNIIAHNTGLVRPDLKDQLPKSLRTVGNEIRLNKQYLREMIASIADAVGQIEAFTLKKFF